MTPMPESKRRQWFFLPRIIGIAGPAGSGKSTAADALVRHWGYERRPFAAKLKQMLGVLGVPSNNLYGSIDQKAQALPLLGGQSARSAMQLLGTEWGRALHPELWTSLWLNTLLEEMDNNVPLQMHFYVADDLRFENEASLIRRLGGLVIHLERPVALAGEALAHKSEAGIARHPSDLVVTNDGMKKWEFEALVIEAITSRCCTVLEDLRKPVKEPL